MYARDFFVGEGQTAKKRVQLLEAFRHLHVSESGNLAGRSNGYRRRKNVAGKICVCSADDCLRKVALP